MKENCSKIRKNLPLFSIGLLSDFEIVTIKKHCSTCKKCNTEAREYGFIVDQIRSADISESKISYENVYHFQLRKCSMSGTHSLIAIFGVLILIVWGIFFNSKTISNNHFADKQLLWKLEDTSGLSPTSGYRPIADTSFIFALKKIDENNKLIAVNKKNGSIVWVSESNCHGNLILDDSKVIAVCPDISGGYSIASFDKLSGVKRWTTALSSSDDYFTEPYYFKNTLLWLVSGVLYCIDSHTGTVRWTREISKRPTVSVCSYQNSVMVANERGILILDKNSGDSQTEIVYPQKMSSLFKPTIIIDTTSMFIAHRRLNSSSVIMCYDLANRSLKWEKSTPPLYSIGVAENKLLLRSQSLYVLSTLTGETISNYDIGGCSPITLHKDICFVVSSHSSASLYSLNLKSGRLHKTFSINSGTCSGVIISGTTGFVNDNSGNIYALNLEKCFKGKS